ncbi:hypothetical protein [Mesorhizobium sp.]|uniref:hypothetical protein n=1 Tax=Mesorhizobium sp. TaxID=1871066 RepID=UPI0025E7EA64|nr:hypothetical protein [Mesorhizobium sp.]
MSSTNSRILLERWQAGAEAEFTELVSHYSVPVTALAGLQGKGLGLGMPAHPPLVFRMRAGVLRTGAKNAAEGKKNGHALGTFRCQAGRNNPVHEDQKPSRFNMAPIHKQYLTRGVCQIMLDRKRSGGIATMPLWLFARIIDPKASDKP